MLGLVGRKEADIAPPASVRCHGVVARATGPHSQTASTMAAVQTSCGDRPKSLDGTPPPASHVTRTMDRPLPRAPAETSGGSNAPPTAAEPFSGIPGMNSDPCAAWPPDPWTLASILPSRMNLGRSALTHQAPLVIANAELRPRLGTIPNLGPLGGSVCSPSLAASRSKDPLLPGAGAKGAPLPLAGRPAGMTGPAMRQRASRGSQRCGTEYPQSSWDMPACWGHHGKVPSWGCPTRRLLGAQAEKTAPGAEKRPSRPSRGPGMPRLALPHPGWAGQVPASRPAGPYPGLSTEMRPG